MAVNYHYVFAELDLATNMCIGMCTSTDEHEKDGLAEWVRIPAYDEEYLFKYYINGSWYEDAEGTIPWTSSLA